MQNGDDISSCILDLKEPLSIPELKALINQCFPVKYTSTSWGAIIVDTDMLKITHIEIHAKVTDKPDLDINLVLIYCDFFLQGKLKYNAWYSLPTIQKGISRCHDKAISGG